MTPEDERKFQVGRWHYLGWTKDARYTFALQGSNYLMADLKLFGDALGYEPPSDSSWQIEYSGDNFWRDYRHDDAWRGFAVKIYTNNKSIYETLCVTLKLSK